MKLTNLKLNAWRQFSAIDIDFHNRMTIVTGANGAGKSTILRLIAAHFGWQKQLLSTPIEGKEGSLEYFTGAQKRRINKLLQPQHPHMLGKVDIVGSLGYSNGFTSEIAVPDHAGVTYEFVFSQQPVQGLFIPSHRQASHYQVVQSIPTNALDAGQAYQLYSQAVMARFNNVGTQFSPTHRLKESLISLATFGPGNKFVRGSQRAEALFEHFVDILRSLLPASLGFEGISIRIPEIVLLTKSGEFLIDSASGGLMSIIDIAWQIFLYAEEKDEFVVVLDEPENHLHPSMQRAILAKLVTAFPRAQFVVATHSPFIVSSVRDSFVYALKYRSNSAADERVEGSSVESIRLNLNEKAGTASDVLRDVLGVPVTLPEWAEAEIRRISERFTTSQMTDDGIAALRRALANEGLEEFYPDALREVLSGR